MQARYSVAKYIPDLVRGEPRNIGVVVWSPDRVEARFIAEYPDRPGQIDGRSIPGFVTSPVAYRQWVQFWRSELSRQSVSSKQGRGPIRREDAAFLDTIQSWNKDNFQLLDGGSILPEGGSSDLATIVQSLFEDLVAPQAEEGRDLPLESVCESIIADSEISRSPHFRRNFPVTCSLGNGVMENFEFSYAYSNASLHLFQRVPFSGRKTILRKTVHDSAWTFEKVRASHIVQPDHGVALVLVSDDQRGNEEVLRALSVLGSVARVVDLSSPEEARAEFRGLSRLG